MSISFPRNINNIFEKNEENKVSNNGKKTLLNYFPYYTKPSNLQNLNNNDKINTTKSKSYFTKSKKNQHFFKGIRPLLDQCTNKKIDVIKNNNENNEIISLNENEKKIKLLKFFEGKKIYIEIFNENENISTIFLEILLEYKIIQCKRLCKNIDYLIFKEGHLKTKKYAIINNIKIVNPLWVDDKINKNIFKNDKEYFVETNMGDILVQENLEKNNISWDKDYENEIEAEYDIEYVNYIDRQRESQNKSRKENNNSKSKSNQIKIRREKRKSKATKNKTKLTFVSENEQPNNNNMLIDDFLETNQISNIFLNDRNENKSSISYINKNYNINHDMKEKENNSIDFKKKNYLLMKK